MTVDRNSRLAAAFRWHGKNVSRFPLAFVVVPLVVAGILCVGMKELTIDTDPDLIWVPPVSDTALQKHFFDAAFDPFFRINQVMLTLDESTATSPPSPAGVLTREYMQAALSLQLALIAGVASDGTTLNEVCYKPIPGQGCLIETPLDYVFSDPVVLATLNDSDIQYAVDCQTLDPLTVHPTYQACFSPIHTPIMPSVVLGGTEGLRGEVPGYHPSICQGHGTYATSLVITFLLQATDALNDHGAAWESDVFLPLVANFSAPGLRASYMAQRSVSDEIAVVDSQNQNIVIISYAVMFCYITLALGKFPHPVFTRALLGLQGIIIVALSVVCAIGVCSWAGMHITMIVNEVVPFLILALGVDNMFILTKAFDRHWRGPYRGRWDPLARSEGADAEPLYRGKSTPQWAAAQALAEVGPTISAAAVSEVLAFGVGATTMIPALQQFCIVAAVAVAFDFFFQITWFSAALVFDGRRQEANRLDALPFIALAHPPEVTAAMALPPAAPTSRFAGSLNAPGSAVAPSSGRGASATEAALAAALLNNKHATIATPTNGVSSTNGHDKPKHFGGDGDGAAPRPTCRQSCRACVLRGQYVRRFCRAYYAPWLLWTPIRLLVLAVWGLFIGGSLYGATQLKLGLEQQLVLPKGSYLTQYFNDQSQLGEAGPPLYLVLQNVNYSDPTAPTTIESLVEQVSALSRWIEPPVANWVADYAYWVTNQSQIFVRNNLGSGCPLPLDPATTPIAQVVAQMILDVPITSACCQHLSYCSAQYSSDVKFLWGVPRNSSVSRAAATMQAAGAVAPPQPSRLGIDDGGCDLSFGYLSHGEVEAAVSHQLGRRGRHNDARPSAIADAVPLHSTTHLTQQGVAALPDRFLQRLRPALRMAGVAAVSIDLDGTVPPGPPALGDPILPLIPCHILTSRLRTQLVALHNQSDFIGAMQHVQAAMANLQGSLPVADLTQYGLSPTGDAPGSAGTFLYNFTSDNEHTAWLATAPGGAMFAYSLTFVYYDQYNYIRGIALTCVLVAVGAVFMASFIVTTPAVAFATAVTVLCVTVDIMGFVWVLNPTTADPYGQGPYGVDVNAVSVVNLVAAVGLSVEFCIHLASYFTSVQGTRSGRVTKALVEMGASVFTGITVTKFVGVSVLAWAPSHLFQLYYFRMYIAIIVFGAFHGLAVLPVVLSFVGWAPLARDRPPQHSKGALLAEGGDHGAGGDARYRPLTPTGFEAPTRA